MQKNLGLHSLNKCDCSCEVCKTIDGFRQGCATKHGTFSDLIVMWEAIFYPQDEFSEWHKRECLIGEYNLCKVDILPICLVEEEGSSSAMVKWKNFSMENIIIKGGEERKKLKLFYKSTISSELIQYLKPKL